MHHTNLKTKLYSLLIVAGLFIFNPIDLKAQAFYFGRNKIQYTDFKWQIMATEHFDIYYYPEMEEIAKQGAQFAEESYKILEPKFNHSINRRIPLIFYSTHLHFQQTNITPGFIPEGIGGFFEFLKGRVVIPSNGDLNQFKHVIRHELVHVFMHSKVYNVVNSNSRLDGPFPPLWFTEGLAEHWSTDWDAQAEMVLKDAVLNNYETGLENIYSINGTFTMYKVGQNILDYIRKNYGDDKILMILENLWKYDRFEDSFKDALGMSYAEFDHEYLYHLKKKYYPMLSRDDFNNQTTITIVRDGFNFKPAYYRDDKDEYVVFVGNRTGYSSIFMKKMQAAHYAEDEEVEVLVKGESSSDFEAFHIFDSKIDVTANGKLVFSSKSGETDALYVFDIPKREITSKHYFKKIVGIFSPSWSPDGKQVVFSGLKNDGYKDLYIFDLESNNLIQLTNDIYNDESPSWAPDSEHIVFSSDRSAYGKKGASNIFSIKKDGSSIRYLTYGNQKDESPVLSPDGNYLAYTSDISGSFNICLIKDPLKNPNPDIPIQIDKITRSVGTIFDPEWTANNELLFGTFENRRFQIRLLNDLMDKIDSGETIEQPVSAPISDLWNFNKINPDRIDSTRPYTDKYSLDIVQTQVSQDPIFGTTGGAQMAFTDLLGNEQYNILLYNNARTSSDLLKSFNFAVTKISLGQKINYAYGVFRFAGEFYNPQDAFYYEDRIGGLFALSYPLSQFTRLEFNQSISYSDKDWSFETRRYAWLNSAFLSFVHDNSIWTYTGPIEGMRLNVTIGNTYDFAFSNVNYLTGLADLRYYYRTGLRTAYAVRFLSLFNEGRETRQFYFGGSWDLRGYPRWSLRGRRIFLLSQELRFPMIDLIGMKLPFFSLGFQQIRGALFFDIGKAWNDKLGTPLGSFGVGTRLPLGFLVLRWDFGKTTDFTHISNGYFTQFFFGWDF
ncbi:MAG: PD40 domain-containing protein [Calditrichaeota bacterium]|nr:PD40 domain-containing protein [Calditrichota bacterium]